MAIEPTQAEGWKKEEKDLDHNLWYDSYTQLQIRERTLRIVDKFS